MHRSLLSALTGLALVGGSLLAPVAASAQHDDIVETAVAAGSFGTLAAALEAAGLVATLKGEGPFTVFAPTDEAFAALPEGTVESLLRPENRETLTAILTYHVVPGRVTAEQVVALDAATTVNGADVRITTPGSGVKVNDANVITTDVMASNGVIHVIDAVLLPPEAMSDRSAERPMSRRDARDAQRARDLLMLAIDRGVPLFNDGFAAGTAGIYEVAARSVLAAEFSLPSRAERALEAGLEDGARIHDPADRAWAYRRALDRALDALDARMALRDRH